jgi:hypothetical protein
MDYSGLSDAYVNISIGDKSVKTKVKDQTNNPTFVEVLQINEIIIYGNIDFIKINPPEISINLFDQDMFSVC